MRYTRGIEPWDEQDYSLIAVCEYCHETLHEVQFGSSIIESLVAGGANIETISRLEYVLMSLFLEGPDCGTVKVPDWLQVVYDIEEMLRSHKK